jgi:ribosomal protein S6--L-glutamate ligase
MKIPADKVIALESRLRECGNVVTLGVKPNFHDYSDDAADAIRRSKKIYYPSGFYAELFDAMGKETFPSPNNYHVAQDKIKQTALFNLIDIPHPKTRVYYGKKQKKSILSDFRFPFIAKVPRGSAMGRGVFLIENRDMLQRYLALEAVAYIQEYLPIDRDMRIVVIGKNIVHAYWRMAAEGEFRSNVAFGARISLKKIPQAACELAIHTASSCNWDDVGLDICEHEGRLYVLEGNMKYGKEGFRAAGIDYKRLMEKMIEKGEI